MKRIKDYILDKDLILKIALIFLIINPILDFYFLFNSKVIEFFHFSPSTIIRTLVVGIIFILFLFVIKKGKLNKWYIVYLVLIVAYSVAHHFSAYNFTAFYPERKHYVPIEELFYLLRLTMPLVLISVLSRFNIGDDTFNKYLSITTIVVGLVIIITNLFKVSMASYGNDLILGNIVCWFKSDNCGLGFLHLSSRGLFQSANSISAYLLMLLPINIYHFTKKSNIINYITIFVSMYAMFLVGTKVSTYGFFLALVGSIILYLMFVIIFKKIKFKKYTFYYLIGTLLLFLLVLPKSTIYLRMNVDKDLEMERLKMEVYNKEALSKMDKTLEEFVHENHLEEHNNLFNSKEDITYQDYLNIMTFKEKSDLIVPFLLDNYDNFSIMDDFIVFHYPYWVDPEMWYNVFHEDYGNRVNYRFLETTFLKRVKEVNNKKRDDYLGITYVRQGKIFTLEKDFLSHYYTLGIIGVILFLMPYVFIVIVLAIRELLRIKNINMKVIYYLFGIGLCLCAGFYSGNVMDSLMVSLTMAYLSAVAINESFGGDYGK